MPVRSSRSAVIKWPDRGTVLAGARSWAAALGPTRPEVARILCFGSVTGDRWGVGSDLDVIIVVASSEVPFEKRGLDYPLPECGVPVDMAVYTAEELARFRSEGRRLIDELDRASLVLYRAN